MESKTKKWLLPLILLLIVGGLWLFCGKKAKAADAAEQVVCPEAERLDAHAILVTVDRRCPTESTDWPCTPTVGVHYFRDVPAAMACLSARKTPRADVLAIYRTTAILADRTATSRLCDSGPCEDRVTWRARN